MSSCAAHPSTCGILRTSLQYLAGIFHGPARFVTNNRWSLATRSIMRSIEVGTDTSIANTSVATAIVSSVRTVRRKLRRMLRRIKMRNFMTSVPQRVDNIEARRLPGWQQPAQHADNHRAQDTVTESRRRQIEREHHVADRHQSALEARRMRHNHRQHFTDHAAA